MVWLKSFNTEGHFPWRTN